MPTPRPEKLIRFATDDGGYIFVDPDTKKVVSVQQGRRRGLPPNTEWAKDAGRGFDRSVAIPPNVRPMQGAPDNSRGNSVIVSPDTAAAGLVNRGTARVSTIVQTPRDGGADAEMLTITLGLQWAGLADGQVPDNIWCQIQAVIEWGVGGAAFRANVDWNNGAVLAIPASFVNVGAIYSALAFNAATPPDVILSASIAYGEPSKKTESRLTQIIDEIITTSGGATPSYLVQVPPFARAFNFFTGNMASPTAVNARFECWSSTSGLATNGFKLAEYNYNNMGNAADQQSACFIIPNGTRSIRIVNDGVTDIDMNAGSSSLSAVVVWDLSI